MNEQNNIRIESLEKFVKDLEQITKKAKERGIKLNGQHTNDKYIFQDLFGK